MDFDETKIYYSHQALQQRCTDENAPDHVRRDGEDQVDLMAVRRHFREFLRNYRQGPHRYLYRDRLLGMHRRSNECSAKLEVDLSHVGEYDAALLGLLMAQPAEVLPPMEAAAGDALRTLLHDMKTDRDQEGESSGVVSGNTEDAGEGQQYDDSQGSIDIQILLGGNLSPTPLRSIKSEHMNVLLKCPGIIISTSPVRSRGTRILIRCARCLHSETIQSEGGPLGGVPLPRRCNGPDPAQCGNSPYGVVTDECSFVDRQTMKLQEAPERVPTGEMPRSVQLAVERSLVDQAPPGTRVNVVCIPTLFSSSRGGEGDSVRSVYLRVVGLQRDSAPGETSSFSLREEEAFRLLARRSDVYQILSRSIAPSISGSYTVDIKKALVCMLMGGTCKRLPDGVRLRGDVNVLLLGDPSTAKSQFLKFASRVAPVGIYTSGKGSSAAGLTASVVKDSRGEFYLEGGAMVLADGGIVAIDEFDKMRPADRVAIHEAMEQQTISVAKAGITTVLNSRTSVLAAANPVFGRYDDLKSSSENIDMMTTILSRFDLIFLVRDIREEERDRMICQHVMGVHISSFRGSAGDRTNVTGPGSGALDQDGWNEEQGERVSTADSAEAIAEQVMRVASGGASELDVPAMQKFIQYCRAKCSPRLSQEAGDVLASSYVKIRDEVRKHSLANVDSQAVIPITVRQLEALVRLSESLAKMRLDSEVRSQDVGEALRLFRVSTMAANAAGNKQTDPARPSLLSAVSSKEEMERTESFLRSRLTIGAIVNKQRLVEEAASQGYSAVLAARALAVMAMRGEVQERNQSRLLRRIK